MTARLAKRYDRWQQELVSLVPVVAFMSWLRSSRASSLQRSKFSLVHPAEGRQGNTRVLL